ncbi:NAD-dependent epimerase/dehydratase family protein [Shewanella marina]|uniref:NAD-dependent epimerase/dehydratase family protein n=1 Tax=Shewanella marina TaxID=487319 RepID=UPI00046F03B8|nr:NAD(P)-dependent oxidoreductase [Shewanella marina]
MKVLVTGSAGRVGRAIYIHLMKHYDVVGFDKTPCSTADFVGDIGDQTLLATALDGVDVIVHTAALHAPHVGLFSEQEFQRINITATENLALLGVKMGIKQFVFTSTTALYGFASTPNDQAGWVNETVLPQPKTIYHHSKIAAEQKLKQISDLFHLPVCVLQMSRCFPEPADMMAVYRLTRGIDARDVASAHRCAIEKRPSGFNRYIISAKTPFTAENCQALFEDASLQLHQYCPELVTDFEQRGWSLPTKLDRVYDSSLAQAELAWQPRFGYKSVLQLLDDEIAEVLPVI